MPNLQLSWSQAAWVGVALYALGLVSGRTASPRLRGLAPFAREAGVIAGLYATWQLAGTLAESGTGGAFSRARWVVRTERWWHLPSERTLQQPLLTHPGWAEAANIYYASMHFTGLFLLLFWLFVRHREHYRPVRSVLVMTTMICLAIQFYPVAPPRLMPASFGFTDIAALHGQSVYAVGAFSADQLSALPSVHVGWALIVGLVPVLYGAGRWRWLAMAHPVITVYVVVATGNHWWLDGMSAAAVLAASVALHVSAGRLLHLRRPQRAPTAEIEAARGAACARTS